MSAPRNKIEIRITLDDDPLAEDIIRVDFDSPTHLRTADLFAVLFAEAIERVARVLPPPERVEWADTLLTRLAGRATERVLAERIRAGFGPVDPMALVTRVKVRAGLLTESVPYRIECTSEDDTATLYVSPAIELRALEVVFGPNRELTVAEVTAALGGAS